jgi:predicted O-methyltransferase YrrM
MGDEDTRIQQVIDSTKGVQHWLKPEEALGIARAADKVKGGNILEIGTGMGRSAIIMALLANGSHVYTVDNMSAQCHQGMTKEQFVEKVQSEADRRDVGDRITLIVSDFRDIPWTLPISLLFIDGYQSYKDAEDTFNKFHPFIEKGGRVVIRDYGTKANTVGVHEHHFFVDKVLANHEEYEVTIDGKFVEGIKK